MKTPEEIKKIILDWIDENDFDIDYSTMENSALVRQKINNYVLEFVVGYDQREKNYRSADWFQPEECDIEFYPDKIEDVTVYLNMEICDLDIGQIETVKNRLYWKIVHKK